MGAPASLNARSAGGRHAGCRRTEAGCALMAILLDPVRRRSPIGSTRRLRRRGASIAPSHARDLHVQSQSMLGRLSPAAGGLVGVLIGTGVSTAAASSASSNSLAFSACAAQARARLNVRGRPRTSISMPGSKVRTRRGFPPARARLRANWSVASKPPIAVCGPPLSAITTPLGRLDRHVVARPGVRDRPEVAHDRPHCAAERLGCTPFGSITCGRDLQQRGHHEVALQKPGVRQGQPVARALLFIEEQQVEVDDARALVEHSVRAPSALRERSCVRKARRPRAPSAPAMTALRNGGWSAS